MEYYVYIAKNPRGKIYIWQTTDLDKRILRHNDKRGSLFTAKYGDFRIVYHEKFLSLLEAMTREKQLKGWTRQKKEALVKGDLKKLKEL